MPPSPSISRATSSPVNNPVTIAGYPGYALAGYIPAAPGLRTVTVIATGGGGLDHFPSEFGRTTDLTFFATG
jgi:hypothetical protein